MFSTHYPRIRELREDYDMTQKEVSEYLNMSQTGYSKYETGENDIPTNVLIQLSKLYNTTVDYILGLTNISSKQKNRYTHTEYLFFLISYL